ncbi:hypothetical protein BGX27_000672, partial [Mortierella sp. AM989]
IMESATKTVFETPELRSRISHFITSRDALACVRVCKNWVNDFTSPIWFTHFDTHKRLARLDRSIITKHGHRVRIVKNMKDTHQIDVVQNPSINGLTSLMATINKTPCYQAHCFDILRRNASTLKDVEISKSRQNIITELFFPIDVLSLGLSGNLVSKLSSLKFRGFTITRATLLSLIVASPLLKILDLTNTTISPSLVTNVFQHQGLVLLVASTTQIFQTNTEAPNAPSLFAHFPNLVQWRVWNEPNAPLAVPVKEIKAEMKRCCRLLGSLFAETSGPIAVELVANGFNSLYRICVLQDQLSPQLILAVLYHQEHLMEICTFAPSEDWDEKEDVPEIAQNQAPGWAIQQIPQRCRHLYNLQLPFQEMDMDDGGMANWSCRFLSVLHIRIRGLDTKEKIKRAIQLWEEKKRKKKEKDREKPADGSDDQYSGDDYDYDYSTFSTLSENLSIEERVANHLFRHKSLREVWLGVKIR